MNNLIRSIIIVTAVVLISGPPAPATVLRVWQQAAGPAHNGTSWPTAFQTIPDAVAAATVGDEVWVAEGAYVGPQIVVSQEMALYGGFAGTESERSQRDPAQHPTVIQCSDPALFAIFLDTDVGPAGVLDGFTFLSGKGVLIHGSPTIRNNVFRDGVEAIRSSGYLSSPRVLNNTVVNMSSYPISFGWSAGTPLVQGNRIDSCYYYGILYVTNVQGQGPSIIGNVITNTYEAISVDQATCYIADNLVVGGEVVTHYSSTIVNNTIVGSHAHGLSISNVHEGIVANNIIAFNGYGIFAAGVPNVDPFALYNNCIYGNTVWNTPPALKDPTGFQGNITVDPQFVNRNGDFHLAATSPLIDAGNDANVYPDYPDLDGHPRVQGAHVDIGAYEFDETTITMVDAVNALRILGGLSAATPDLVTRLNVEAGGGVDLVDAVRLVRKAAGLG